MFRLYFAAGVVALILGLSATAYIYYLKYQNIGQQLETALSVNQNNQRVVRELELDKQIEREITKKEIAATQKRATAIEDLLRKLQNAQGADDPVSPYFDELGDGLRSLNSGTAD